MNLLCRCSIALGAILAIFLTTSKVEAQVLASPTPRQPGGLANDLVTGVEYDRVNQAFAVRRLEKVQAKLARNREQGNLEAADRNVYRIDSLRYRISIDEWLIRKNSGLDPCFFPGPVRIDPLSCAVMAGVRRPAGTLDSSGSHLPIRSPR